MALTGTISSARARKIDNAERLKRTRERNLIEYGRKSGPTRAQVARAMQRYLRETELVGNIILSKLEQR
jgi:hypothetical protein